MESCSCKCNVGGVERLGCMAFGGWLLLKGLVSRRAFPTALGGLFIYRGITGNCKGYEAMGIDTRSEAEKAAN